jgi:hypothetical protein
MFILLSINRTNKGIPLILLLYCYYCSYEILNKNINGYESLHKIYSASQYYTVDLPPKKEPSYNVSLEGQ